MKMTSNIHRLSPLLLFLCASSSLAEASRPRDKALELGRQIELKVEPVAAISGIDSINICNGSCSRANNRDDNGCLKGVEFACWSERRCIPRSWRCDFTEQCLAGDDEFGCLPERCDFEHDLCNWRNERRPIVATSGAADPSANQQWIWRRYHAPEAALPPPVQLIGAANCSEPLVADAAAAFSCGASASQAERKLARLAAKLEASRDSASGRGRFLYVPLAFGELSGAGRAAAGSRRLLHSTSSTRLRAPLISQTDSRCQLSFKYALWISELPAALLASHSLRLHLALQLHSPPGRAAGGALSQPRPLWRAFKGAQPDPFEESELDWRRQVLDIGHVREAQLNFQARLTLLPIKAGGGAGSQRALISTLAGLVAIHSMEFRNCAWPQGAYQQPALLPLAHYQGPLEPPRPQQSPGACASHQFRCPSGVCLEQRRLCDHLRDCLPEGGDEAPELCGSVAGMEDFESDAPPVWAPDPAPAFWTLTGSFPPRLVSRQRAAPWLLAHLPRRDHTNGTGGHYLSLDLAGAAESGGGRERHWLHLNSALMRRKPGTECRLKLFYNLVAAGGHWPRAAPFKIYIALEHFVFGPGVAASGQPVARKQHFLLHSAPPDEQAGAVEAPGVDFWRELNHKLVGDEIGHEQLFYARLAVIVEPIKQSPQWAAPKADTIKLAHHHQATLNIDDLSTHFGCEQLPDAEVRALASPSTPSSPRWYLNGSFDKNDYLQTEQQTSLLNFYPAISERHRRHQSEQLNSARQFEPHKLVICVVAVLSSIAGLIIIIVFIIVPYVERIAISYHDQLAANLSFVGSLSNAHSGIATISDQQLPISGQTTANIDSDWEQVSKRWRRSTINGIISSESELSELDSLARQQNLTQASGSSSSQLTHNDSSSSSLASNSSNSPSSNSSNSSSSTSAV